MYWRFIFLFGLIFLLPGCSGLEYGIENFKGCIYVVSPYGNDAYPGTKNKPFRTIQRAADVMTAGDICLIKDGVYRETVRPACSGTAEAPIVFAPYAGHKPVISGADILDGWVLHCRGIYKTTIAANKKPFNQLFVDGRMYNEARWPNTGVHRLVNMNRASAEAGTNAKMLVDRHLPEGNWKGAKVHIVPGEGWISFSKTISEYLPGQSLVFSDALWHDSGEYCPRAGNYYWISGALAGLDVPGEWCLVDSGKETYDCYIRLEDSSNPKKCSIEIKSRRHGFDLTGRSHIYVRGLRFFAAAILMDDAESCRIEDCRLQFVDHFTETDGYLTAYTADFHSNRMSGSNNIWQRCSIEYSAGNGIFDNGRCNTVAGCTISNVDYSATYAACITVGQSGSGGRYVGNTMYESGRFIFWHSGSFDRCTHNKMSGAGRLTNDCGITYSWGSDGNGAVISYNHIFDNTAEKFPFGIYIDNFCRNYTIHHNLIRDIPETAIMISCPIENVLVFNNTILESCGEAFNQYTPPGQRSDQSSCRIANNLYKTPIGKFAIIPPVLENNRNYRTNPDGTLPADSDAVDSGIFIPTITEHWAGDSPDIGCYEFGVPKWSAGAGDGF